MKNDGGPAFPRTVFAGTPKEMEGEAFNNGLSLRDYFAAAALQGDLASQSDKTGEWQETMASILAKRCFTFADAMLAERATNLTQT